jgi:hypothetical protein
MPFQRVSICQGSIGLQFDPRVFLKKAGDSRDDGLIAPDRPNLLRGIFATSDLPKDALRLDARLFNRYNPVPAERDVAFEV